MRLLPALHVLGRRCSHVTPVRPVVRVLLGCSLAERLRRHNWNGRWPHLPAEHSISDVRLRRSSSHSSKWLISEQCSPVLSTGLLSAAQCCMPVWIGLCNPRVPAPGEAAACEASASQPGGLPAAQKGRRSLVRLTAAIVGRGCGGTHLR